MSYFVTDNPGHLMTLETSEKLNEAEPETYEERFPFEGELVFCYVKGDLSYCESFINSKTENVREALVIKKIED